MNRQQRRSKITKDRAAQIAECAQHAASDHAVGMLLAGSCLALHEVFGFDKEQCAQFLKATQEKTLNAFCATELMDALKQTLDLDIRSEIE